MTCEYPGETEFARSSGYKDSGWWAGLGYDTDPRTGESRRRLVRAVKTDRGSWEQNQTWRVRDDYWHEEHRAVERIKSGAGTTSPPATPTDPTIDVQRYLEIRRDNHRWVAAVRVYNENCWTEQTRLYHWDPQSWKRRQCWTVSPMWPKVTRLVGQHVSPTP